MALVALSFLLASAAGLSAPTAELAVPRRALLLRGEALSVLLGGAALASRAPRARADAPLPPVPVDPFNSMCMGFGCNPVKGAGFAGAARPDDEDSITFTQFMALVDAGAVRRVEFSDVAMGAAWAVVAPGAKFARVPAAGRGGGLAASAPIAARALSEGAAAAPPPPPSAAPASAPAAGGDPQRVRIGEGYPIDTGDSWSTPLFVKRILDNKSIPYSFVGALKRRS